LTGRAENIDLKGSERQEEPWIELIDRVDSSDFSKLFRNLVLVAGLLYLRESSESARIDLQTIIQETSKFSKRIASAREKHPEVKVLESIEGNLGEFSVQTEGFNKALLASELREELELLSLSLLLSRSPSSEGMRRKVSLAKKVTKLARHMKIRDERLEEKDSLSKMQLLMKRESSREKDREGSRIEE
jgi:hypothetical protein